MFTRKEKGKKIREAFKKDESFLIFRVGFSKFFFVFSSAHILLAQHVSRQEKFKKDGINH